MRHQSVEAKGTRLNNKVFMKLDPDEQKTLLRSNSWVCQRAKRYGINGTQIAELLASPEFPHARHLQEQFLAGAAVELDRRGMLFAGRRRKGGFYRAGQRAAQLTGGDKRN